MKKLYIPKGTTCHYESLETDHIIVKGCLKVDGAIKCRHLSGKGVVEAGLVSADTVVVSDLETADVVARTLLCERACVCQAHVTEHMAVSCYLEAQTVDAGKLTVARNQIGELRCDDVVNLPIKSRKLFGTLLASFLRDIWSALTCRIPSSEVLDAEWKPAAEEKLEDGGDHTEQPQPEAEQPRERKQVNRFDDLQSDFEFLRLAGLYRLLKDQGYYVRITPVDPTHPAEPLSVKEIRPEPAAEGPVVLPAA